MESRRQNEEDLQIDARVEYETPYGLIKGLAGSDDFAAFADVVDLDGLDVLDVVDDLDSRGDFTDRLDFNERVDLVRASSKLRYPPKVWLD